MASRLEMSRRYGRLREVMGRAGYRALIIAGNSEGNQRGYIRYLSDWRLFGGTGYLIFSVETEPIFVLGLGAQAEWARELSTVADTRGVLSKMAEVSESLRQLGIYQETIGIVGLNKIMPYGDYDALRIATPRVRFVDATMLLERLMVVLSAEEIQMAEHSQALVSTVYQLFQQSLVPGRSEREVTAEAYREAAALGCYDGMIHLTHDAKSGTRPASERLIGEEDIIKVFMEFAGPSGYIVELGGICSFSPPPKDKRRKYDIVVKATLCALDAAVPGMVAGDLCQIIRQIYIEDGWEIVGRRLWDFHGQGLHSLLPPFGLPNSKEVLQENMIINIHPGILTADEWGVSVTSNFLVTPTGGRSLGTFIHQWHVLG